MASEKRIIESSNTKTILLIVIGLGFVSLGVWFLMLDPAEIESQRRFNNPILIYGIGVASISFFGLCTAACVWRLFSGKPGLELSNEGINIFSMGPNTLIPWSDISGFSIHEIHNQKMLVINLHKPDKYIEIGSKLRRQVARASYNMCGSPIAISTSTLKLNFKELCELCEQYFQQYRGGGV